LPRLLSFFLALAALPCLASISPDAGQFSIRTFSSKAYGGSPQNWAVLAAANGLVYFGNTDGVLEYDGVLWRKIELPGGGTVRSLAQAEDGTIYVGGQSEAGYLAPNAAGQAAFVSLRDKLPANEREFGDVWSIITMPEGVYFSASDRLLFYNAKMGVKSWKGPGRFRRAYKIGGQLHVNILGAGFHRFAEGKLELIPGGAEIVKLDVRGFYNSPSGTVLATNKGFYLASADGLRELSTEVGKLTPDALLYTVFQIRENLVAFGTARGGLILADAEGKVLRVLTQQNGLPKDYVTSIGSDNQGGVWLGTSQGIARFQPRFTEYDEESGLRGTLFALGRWREGMYAGTTSGLFRLKADPMARFGVFETVAEIKDSVYCMTVGPDALYVGTQRGLYAIQEGAPKFLAQSDVVYDINVSADAQRLYTAGRSGVLVFTRKDGQWAKSFEVPSKGEEFRTIAEGTENTLWVTTRTDILRIREFHASPQITRYKKEDGLPEGWKSVFRLGGRLYFATELGLIKPGPDGRNFVADSSLGPNFTGRAPGIQLMRQDAQGNLWISAKGYHGLLSRPGKAEAAWNPMRLAGAGLDELWTVLSDPDGVVWASGPDSRLIRYDTALDDLRTRPFTTYLRSLLVSQEQRAIFGGFVSPANELSIPYTENTIRAEFSAPYYDAQDRVQYQFTLGQAFNKDTPWSKEAWKDLSNLWEGQYRIQVRARNPQGDVSPSATLQFSIAPPWFRTWYAYLLYGCAAIGAVWSLIRWRLRSLKQSNLRLEGIVSERTAEIRQQRDKILEHERRTEALLLNILPAPVAEELRTHGAVQPMYFDDVTVCFTDFVGFTISSEKLEAGVLVEKLHEYFTAFDEIIARFGLEKLKTIGDSYMFVSGLPQADSQHAVKAVQAALEIVAAAQGIGDRDQAFNWSLRVGLHSGPVVAGVVGSKKFAFDIWGDTVNLASRMESSGAPNRVNVSERTYSLIQHEIECESRGPVRTKDGRALPMYFAVSTKAIATSASD
jgi:class 3 adenylate cyclase